MQIKGILLAAGVGSRFGSQKLLAQLSDGTPIAVAAWLSLSKAHQDSIAVIRHGDHDVKHCFISQHIPFIECPDASLGMSRSLITAVQHTLQSDGWIIALGDMPFIKPATISKLKDELCALSEGQLFARPRFNNKEGNPVGISKKLQDELLKLEGDEGARTLIKRHRSAVRLFDVEDAGILRDVDTPEDLKAAD